MYYLFTHIVSDTTVDNVFLSCYMLNHEDLATNQELLNS